MRQKNMNLRTTILVIVVLGFLVTLFTVLYVGIQEQRKGNTEYYSN